MAAGQTSLKATMAGGRFRPVGREYRATFLPGSGQSVLPGQAGLLHWHVLKTGSHEPVRF